MHYLANFFQVQKHPAPSTSRALGRQESTESSSTSDSSSNSNSSDNSSRGNSSEVCLSETSFDLGSDDSSNGDVKSKAKKSSIFSRLKAAFKKKKKKENDLLDETSPGDVTGVCSSEGDSERKHLESETSNFSKEPDEDTEQSETDHGENYSHSSQGYNPPKAHKGSIQSQEPKAGPSMSTRSKTNAIELLQAGPSTGARAKIRQKIPILQERSVDVPRILSLDEFKRNLKVNLSYHIYSTKLNCYHFRNKGPKLMGIILTPRDQFM